MDDIFKILLANSPYAAALFGLGRQALNVLREYLQMVVQRHDLVLARLAVIEKQLNITPPQPEVEKKILSEAG